ncbi:thioredoxin [Parapusillimonas sp. JC17]|uniref:thioredoxin n=1 Tax=Parapusillimonas sp. JC17 TaxID=3445768 RepID=UPI003F9FC90D
MIKELTSENFDTAIGLPGVHVMRFWAEWCGPCRAMSPTFKQTASDMADNAQFGEINVDHAPELAHRFEVQSIPAVLVFKNGSLVNRTVGAIGKAQLNKFVKQHLE